MSDTFFLIFILSVSTFIILLHQKSSKLQALPLILLLYLSFMILGNLGLWDAGSASIASLQQRTISNLLPAMIFLMMLGFDSAAFRGLGRKGLIAFFATTASIILSFVTLFYLFRFFLWKGANLSLATLAGSWSGGTINMIAVANIIGIDETALGAVVIVDTIVYSVWVMFLLLIVPFAHRFNRFSKAEMPLMDIKLSCCINNDIPSYIRIILISILLAFTVNLLSYILPTASFISPSFYAVVLATFLGLLASKSRLKELPAQSVANAMLYLIIALIASKAHITELSTSLAFLSIAFAILFLHALIMLGFAKLFKLDLFTLGIASLAHIGGAAGATVLASSYHKSLIPVAVVMATGGYLLGTFVGLFIAYLLGV